MSCLRYGITTVQSLKIIYLKNHGKISTQHGKHISERTTRKSSRNAVGKQEITNSWQHNYVFFKFHKFIITKRTLGGFVVVIPKNTISHVSLIANINWSAKPYTDLYRSELQLYVATLKNVCRCDYAPYTC